MDTELIATTALKERISFCDGLQSYISERDKEPLWDGYIYVYPKGSSSKDEHIGRVPVQVKGKKKTVSKKTTHMSYSVEVNSLKQYFNDGGVIYFVVAYAENRTTTIFYKILLPFDLNRAIENSGGQKTKNINLQKFPDDCDSIRRLFITFIHDKQRQATRTVWSKEQAEKAVMDGGALKFHILPRKHPESYDDVLKELTLQDIYLYVDTKDGVEFPFEKIESSDFLKAVATIDVPVSVNGEIFYHDISRGYENGNGYIYIGHVVKIPFAEAEKKPSKITLKFLVSGSLNDRITDSNFILAIAKYKNICIGTEVKFNASIDKPQELSNLKAMNSFLKKIRTAFDYFGMLTDFDMNNLSEQDKHNIDILIAASLGKTLSFNGANSSSIFYYNTKIGGTTILTVAKLEENSNKYRLYNAFHDEVSIQLQYVDDNNNKVTIRHWPLFLYMKAEHFLCSNIDYSIILKSINSMDTLGKEFNISIPNSKRTISANSMLLEAISAYDSMIAKDKKLLQFTIDVAEAIKTESPVTIINKYQTIKRLRGLKPDEIADLVELCRKNEDCLIKCGVAIVLGETSSARNLLEKMSDEEKRRVIDFPIYQLLLSYETGTTRL